MINAIHFTALYLNKFRL